MEIRKQNRLPLTPVLIVLLVVLVLSIMLAVTFGTVHIPFGDVYSIIARKLFGVGGDEFASGRLYDVVWLIRLPRLLLAVGVGAALSVSGLVMQAIVKNPIAEPYVLGVSSGAYAGAAMAILLGTGGWVGGHSTGIMAFLGAFISSLAVIFIANLGSRANAVKLILAGAAVNAVCQAFANFIIYFSHDTNAIHQLVYWTMGSLAGAQWNSNALLLVIVTLCILFFWSQYRTLNLMLLGDDAAVTLGTNLHHWRLLYLLACALLIGLAVNAAGMIGFVGLVVPHVVRLIFGVDHKRLVPLCALVGAILLVWADVLCRTVINGVELPIGILTSMIGAPCFIYLIARRKYQFGGDG